MTAIKMCAAAFALTFAFAGTVSAQTPFGIWNPAPRINCPNGNCNQGCCVNGTCSTGQCVNGQCPPAQCVNGQCPPRSNVNCVNGVCYQTPAMNCANGVCQPAYGTVSTPVYQSTNPVRSAPWNASSRPAIGSSNSPYFQPGASTPQFNNPNRNNFSAPTQNYTTNYAPAMRGRLEIPANMSGIAQLPEYEQQAALTQRTCPLTGRLLGSHGVPVRQMVNGRNMFVCCQNCSSGNGQYLTNSAPQYPVQFQAAIGGVTLH